MRHSRYVLAEEIVVVPALAQELGAVHSALERLWAAIEAARLQSPDELWRAEFATAVGEIGANIAEHAHPPDRPPGTMCLRLRLFSARVEARFADNGVPYRAALPAPAEDESGELAEGGYGLPIVRSAIDYLRYRRSPGGINVWRLIKRLPAHVGA